MAERAAGYAASLHVTSLMPRSSARASAVTARDLSAGGSTEFVAGKLKELTDRQSKLVERQASKETERLEFDARRGDQRITREDAMAEG